MEVVSQPRSFVSQVRIDYISKIYQIQTPLECMAARVVAETIEDPALAVLDRLETNLEFQRTVITCARNRRL
jgi:DNA-binding GntR family transcriptional regulator